MNFFDLKNIAERYIDLLNPISSEKIIKMGTILDLKADSNIIDFGSGNGEVLFLLNEGFGISGLGLDCRLNACERARQKIKQKWIGDKVKILCRDASEYKTNEKYDVALCIGASFIWGNYRDALQAMKEYIKDDGKIAIGEVYWKKSSVPEVYRQKNKVIFFEKDILDITREEGFCLEYLIRSNQDEWDKYYSENWRGLISWLKENPNHSSKDKVKEHLVEDQDDYFGHIREYIGWAIYIMTKIDS